MTVVIAKDSAASSRKPWPISTFRLCQSIDQGPISTTTPASPNPAAIQRPGGMRSCKTSRDIGTTKIVVVLARIAVRLAEIQSTARCAKAKKAASDSTPTVSKAGRSARCGRRRR